MVTFNDLLSWNGTSLYDAGDALVAASHKYEQVNTDLSKSGLGDGLAGQTAEAEAKARRILADDAEDLWTGLSKAGNDLKDASDTVNIIGNAAHNLVTRIKGDDLEISETGAITPSETGSTDGEARSRDVSRLIWDYERERDRLVEQADDTITFISSVYDAIASLDDTANGPSPEVVNHGDRPPNPSWTPSQVNDWWTSLSPELQQHIINKHPSWIGNLDGIPASDRHQANMVWLAVMQKEMDEKVADFQPKATLTWHSTAGGSGYYTETPNPEYEALVRKQEELNNISASLNSEESKAAGRTLLVLDDSSGDHFRAAVGSGDVDNADHVLVFTPGMTTQATPGLFGKDGSTGGSVRSSENILDGSGLAWKPGDKGQETAAAVTWLGYDAPNWSETLLGTDSSVLSPKEAQSAGPDLASFYDGLQETHHGDPHLVAAGHSYGSTATGYALQESSTPDDVVVWGSPGVTSVDASDLGMLPDHMYAAATGDDVVAMSGRYGGDPTSHPDSDFTSLDTHATGDLTESTGHSSYANKDTTSLDSISQILRGQQPTHIDHKSIGN